MHKLTRSKVAAAVSLALTQAAFAGSGPFFVPLTASEPVEPADAVDELNSPWITPAGVTLSNLTSMDEIEDEISQSVGRVLPSEFPAADTSRSTATMWDMLAFSPDGKHVYIPHESPVGAGVSRYDMDTDTTTLIFVGDKRGGGPDGVRGTNDDQWETDYGAFDPARYTPNGTVIAAEEWAGLGRVVEICDPLDNPADPRADQLTAGDCATGADYRELPIANVSHEGINFSLKKSNEVIYFIDEDRSGSIYKMEFATPGDYAGGGTTYVLQADNYTGDVVPNWDDSDSGNSNPVVLASRFGPATWIPLTDAAGDPLPGINPITGASVINCNAGDAEDECRDEDVRPGRVAADDAGGTPWGRPEDMAIGMLPNGNEILYTTVTSENAVISIEILDDDNAVIRSFARNDGVPNGSNAGTPTNVGFAPTTATLNSPDNLAIDSLGNVYIIEDAPNSSSTGGDIWFARDADNDGIAESLDQFLSIQVNGSEATGMIFNPADPTKFVVAVQHPTSVIADEVSEISDGFGDAMWEFDLSGTMPPKCDGPRRNFMTYNMETRRWVRACSAQRDYNAIDQIAISDTSDTDFPNP
jgi:hypothetical protein